MTTATDKTPRERILETAAELFYHQGYRATGTNEVIEKAGVAKATFYKHFPTKDDLCLAYLKERNAREALEIETCVYSRRTALTRLFAVIEALEPWAKETGFRGCAFLNMVPEVPDVSSPLREEGKRHYDAVRALVLRLAEELVKSDKGKYAHLDAKKLSEDYMAIFTGSIALTGIYKDIWPIRQGISSVHNLI